MASSDQNVYPIKIYYTDEDPSLASLGNRGRSDRKQGASTIYRGRQRDRRPLFTRNVYAQSTKGEHRDNANKTDKEENFYDAENETYSRQNETGSGRANKGLDKRSRSWCESLGNEKPGESSFKGRGSRRGRSYGGRGIDRGGYKNGKNERSPWWYESWGFEGQHKNSYRGRGSRRGNYRGRGMGRLEDVEFYERPVNGLRKEYEEPFSNFTTEGDIEASAYMYSVSERSRGRGKRRGTQRLTAYRSEASHDLIGASKSLVTRGEMSEEIDNVSRKSPQVNEEVHDDNVMHFENTLKPPEFKLGYRKLGEWSKMTEDPDDLVLTIANTRSGLVGCLENPLKPDWIHRILEILSVACKTQTCTQHLRDLLLAIQDTLLPQINDFLSQILSGSDTHRHLFRDNKELTDICESVIHFLKYQMNALPTSLSKCIPIILSLKQVQNEFHFENETLSNEIKELEVMKNYIKEERESLRKCITKSSKDKKQIGAETDPPESFRELSILPSADELLFGEKPFLRPNLEEGQFKDLEQYLDIHFRLLREDFIRPLRESIRDYKRELMSTSMSKKVGDIRLYNNVQVLMPVCSVSGICHVLQFDVNQFSKINWSTSDRLRYGSLVCLSADDFDTITFGFVTKRDQVDLSKGQIQVLLEINNDGSDIKPNVTYVMAETTAYFESYRHILGGLQQIQDNMPLQKYILHCETDVQVPRYLLLQDTPTYDFTCIMSKDARERGLRELPALTLNTSTWPTEEDLNLDCSQMEAMKMALTNEIALIQGPPGTGKTYVGLKIVKMLLANKGHWINDGNKTCPILVLCQTNHALDQFLEGIFNFCKADIVRVGGRSKSTILEPFVLKNIRENRRREKARTIGQFKAGKDSMDALQRSKQQIEKISEKIKESTTKLLPVTPDKGVMSERHRSSLQKRVPKDFREVVLSIWLGLTTEEEEARQVARETLPWNVQCRDIWKDIIINDIPPMPAEDSRSVKNIHELDLLKRAQLYKAWNEEINEQLMYSLHILAKGNKIWTRKLQSHRNAINTDIMSLEYLDTAEFKIPHEYNFQIMQLRDTSITNRTNGHLESWLCLDLSDESSAKINEAIEKYLSSVFDNEVEEDLEEDRQLDVEETDDFLQEYNSHTLQSGFQRTYIDETDWATIIREKRMENKLRKVLNKPSNISDDNVACIDDVWELSKEKREDLYRYWVHKYRTVLKQEIREHEKEYRNAVTKYQEVMNIEHLDILRNATVIGMTTTGAAKNRTLLQEVGPKILIVEEAAEVLESHVVANLNENTQHLILIGDHKQLRPTTAVYDLGKRYKLDISLFERMIINGLLYVTLTEQHRMRPEISVLMRHITLYPQLKDHASVKLFEDILGVGSNVCFIDHKELEEQRGESTSYFNTHEVNFLAALCKHLLMQGYNSEQITILSPYMSQVLTLRKSMPQDEYGRLRITPVDNFQGEENDIILLSLVRSGAKDKSFIKKNPIGFLAIENRVCVALSRAKKGLFVIGNFDHLASNSDLWQYVVDTMRKSKKLKRSVTLKCQNHPDSVIEAASENDFKKAPEGGCNLSCKFPLKCGHVCLRFCHILDTDHEMHTCLEPCVKTNPCGHKCEKKCFERCAPCQTVMEKKIPQCGHIANMKCSDDPKQWMCTKICLLPLPCGHKCEQNCSKCSRYKVHRYRCEVMVEKKLSCGHTIIGKCFEDPESLLCPIPCKIRLNCGHTCFGTCGECLEGRLHMSCTQTCSKTLPCGHKCSYPCSEICPPCTRKCAWKCSHIQCPYKCWQECHKCIQDCTTKCPHMKCERECFEECENYKCDLPCEKSLPCGHPCVGLCGEVCPNKCLVCEPEMFTKADERMVFLEDCKCIVSVQRMDNEMKQPLKTKMYRTVPFFCCPDCKKPIVTTIKRYINCMKERRNVIAKRYLALTGTVTERQKETDKLRTKIRKLKRIGLSSRDAETLERQMDNADDVFGRLHNTKRKTAVLEELLQLFCEMQSVKSKYKGHIHKQGSRIKDRLMVNKRFITSQFWNEAHDEIEALRALLHSDEKTKPSTLFQKNRMKNATTNSPNGIEKRQGNMVREKSAACITTKEDAKFGELDGRKDKIKETDLASDEIVSASDEVNN